VKVEFGHDAKKKRGKRNMSSAVTVKQSGREKSQTSSIKTFEKQKGKGLSNSKQGTKEDPLGMVPTEKKSPRTQKKGPPNDISMV